MSGLVIFVIVAAWLAVLVPMALRSHDTATRSADRFGDAMRVLSRRGAAGTPAPLERLLSASLEDPPLTPAQRRQRLLLALLGATAVALLGSLAWGALLWVGLVLVVVTAAYVAHLRRLVLRRRGDLSWPQEPYDAGSDDQGSFAAGLDAAGSHDAQPYDALPYEAPAYDAQPYDPAARVRTVRVQGIPDRMPARGTAAAPAVRYDAPQPAATWDPVPVPRPVYATKPTAPPRPPRVIDLTSPGEWTASVDLDVEPDPDLHDILERRRAVGGW